MEINLQNVDDVIKRQKVSYRVAKEALERSEGDVLEAIMLLEKEKKAIPGKGFMENIKQLICKLNEVKLSFEKNGDALVRLPGTLAILLFLLFMPFMIVSSLVLMFLGYSPRFRKNDIDLPINQHLEKLKDDIAQVGK